MAPAGGGGAPQVVDEGRPLAGPRFRVALPQQGGGMQRRHDLRPVAEGQDLAAALGHLEAAAEQRLRGGGAQGHHQARRDGRQFRLQPGGAGLDLAAGRLLVQAARAARLPLEVLDRIGDVNPAAVDASRLQRLVQKPAGRADEGVALEVLLIARLFADHHERCGLRSFPEHRGRGVSVQRAAAAALRGIAQRRQRVGIVGQVGGGGGEGIVGHGRLLSMLAVHAGGETCDRRRRRPPAAARRVLRGRADATPGHGPGWSRRTRRRAAARAGLPAGTGGAVNGILMDNRDDAVKIGLHVYDEGRPVVAATQRPAVPKGGRMRYHGA